MQTDHQHNLSPRQHGQTYQDDHFDDLACFAEQTMLHLMLAAIKRTLNQDELAILDRAAHVVGELHPLPMAGESRA